MLWFYLGVIVGCTAFFPLRRRGIANVIVGAARRLSSALRRKQLTMSLRVMMPTSCGGVVARHHRQPADVVVGHVVGRLPDGRVVVDEFRRPLHQLANRRARAKCPRPIDRAASARRRAFAWRRAPEILDAGCRRCRHRATLGLASTRSSALSANTAFDGDLADEDLIECIGDVLGRRPHAAAGDLFGHDRVPHQQARDEIRSRAAGQAAATSPAAAASFQTRTRPTPRTPATHRRTSPPCRPGPPRRHSTPSPGKRTRDQLAQRRRRSRRQS